MAAAPVRVRRPAVRIPRRVSGSLHRPAPAAGAATGGRRAIGLDRNRLVEAIIHRRLWIPMLGVALLGIVFMQVSMLSMNAAIGRSVKDGAALERENADLRAQLSRLSIGNSLADAAAQAGMVVPEAGDYRVLTAGGGDTARRAAGRLTDPIAPVQPSVPVASSTTSTPPAGASATGTPTTAEPTAQTQTQTPESVATTAAPAAENQATQSPVTPLVTTPGGGTSAPGQ